MRVLIVDDEPDVADLLASILKAHGDSAVAVYCLRSAREALKEFSPNIVITDCALPDGTGIDLALEVVAMCPHSRILLFSSSPDHARDLLTQRHLTDSVALLEKPVPVSDVLDALRQLWGGVNSGI